MGLFVVHAQEAKGERFMVGGVEHEVERLVVALPTVTENSLGNVFLLSAGPCQHFATAVPVLEFLLYLGHEFPVLTEGPARICILQFHLVESISDEIEDNRV